MKETVIHMWDVHEIVLHAAREYANPYTDVTVWAQLKGPGFDKRVYGFWDGDGIWRIRVTATAPGTWTYTTGASVPDAGLAGISGGYFALEWTEEERKENPCRRGIIRATANGHAMEYADGTPFFMVGDTWWPLSTYRFPWVEDEQERPIGPDMSMKDMARHRLKQGYNCIGTIVAYPTWAKDDYPATVRIDDEYGTFARGAWAGCSVEEWYTKLDAKARDMHNEGGRPFFFPGRIKGYEDLVPDYDRINPKFFQAFDKKVNWLNQHGITVFMEAMRRDCSKTWKYYYDWPMVYTRYIQYLSARYQANNTLYSPIHFDGKLSTIDSREFNEPINLMIDLYGAPPFGTLLGTNSPGSSKIAYGGPQEQHWKTFDQTGNWRDHQYYWLLTDMYHDDQPAPSINGEPYYSGHTSIIRDDDGNITQLVFGNVNSVEDHLNCRSCYYGSVLSGAYGGLLAGFEAGWSGNVEPEEEPWKIWDVMTFPASDMVQYVRDFLFSEGKRYQELIPDQNLVSPNYNGPSSGWRGWTMCSATKERDLVMGYSEKGALKVKVRGLRPYDSYELSWFNPRIGRWLEQKRQLTCSNFGEIVLGDFPDGLDWAWKVKKTNTDLPIDRALHEDGTGKNYHMGLGFVPRYHIPDDSTD